MFKVSVLASGSKGNCTVAKTESTKILIDAGMSGKKIVNALNHHKLNENRVNAVIISHEHHDHVSGAGVICRRLDVPLYISKKTYFAKKKKLGKIPDVRFFEVGSTFEIGNIIVDSFPSPHDAVDSSNFILYKKGCNQRKLGVITDLGYRSKLLITKLRNVTTLVLESNHDVQMLMSGPYPWSLKQRVKSKHGHLSNEQAISVVSQIIHSDLKTIILAHLSEKNNNPDIAFNKMASFLQTIRKKTNLYLASQDVPTQLIDI